MKMQTFEKGIALLSASFPDKQFDSRALWVLLRDLTDEKFLQSIEIICRSKVDIYPGTNITALIREKALGPNEYLLSAEAIEIVFKEISRVGSYGIPKFDDPIVEKTVNCMGWKELCRSDVEDRNIIRAQFFKIYDSFLNREKEVKLVGDGKTLIEDIVKKIGNG